MSSNDFMKVTEGIAQEGLDAIGADMGREPTRLSDLRKRPALVVAGGSISAEVSGRIEEAGPRLTLARAARLRRTVARVGRRPRRWVRTEALLVELRHALCGKSADVEGYRASLVEVAPAGSHVELTFTVDLGDVTLGVPLDRARELLAEADPTAVLFGMVAEVVRAEERGEGLPS